MPGREEQVNVHLTSISEKFEWCKMKLCWYFLCQFSSALVFDAVSSTGIVIGH